MVGVPRRDDGGIRLAILDVRIWLFIYRTPPPEPEPNPQPEADPTADDLLDHRLEAFYDLGFDPMTALALAWNRVSPAEARERFLKRGATHDEAARALL
jgi:hypothetical protein